MADIGNNDQVRFCDSFAIGFGVCDRYKTITLAPDNWRWGRHAIKISTQPWIIRKLPGKPRQCPPGENRTHYGVGLGGVRNSFDCHRGVWIAEHRLSHRRPDPDSKYQRPARSPGVDPTRR